MLTNTYVFNASSMRELREKLKTGDWKWPKDIKFSLQGLEFLSQTF